MEPKDLKRELESAYKLLEEKERQIKNLLIERKQNNMVMELLETAGFVKEGKLEEAKEFVQTFKT